MGGTKRLLGLWDAGESGDAERFVADQLMMALAGRDRRALVRLWHRGRPGLSLGRFHRLPYAASDMGRRISGGRVLALSPGVLCVTMAFPDASWLDPGGPGLSPDRVLNRALRPLLAALRSGGADVIYPGRDLVTLSARPLAHASFTVASDGVCLVEAHLGLEESFAATAALLAEQDPEGTAGVDVRAFSDAVSLAAAAVPVPPRASWAPRLAEKFRTELACEVELLECGRDAAAQGAHDWSEAYESFQHALGPAPAGRIAAARPGMLGLVECSARLEDGRLSDLRITGDVIAPFHTLEALRHGCEGLPYEMPLLRRLLARIMSGSRNFILGINDVDGLIQSMG